MNEYDPNFGGIENLVDERTEIEIAEHAVYSNLERLLNAGCLTLASNAYQWLGQELKKRVRDAAE